MNDRLDKEVRIKVVLKQPLEVILRDLGLDGYSDREIIESYNRINISGLQKIRRIVLSTMVAIALSLIALYSFVVWWGQDDFSARTLIVLSGALTIIIGYAYCFVAYQGNFSLLALMMYFWSKGSIGPGDDMLEGERILADDGMILIGLGTIIIIVSFSFNSLGDIIVIRKTAQQVDSAEPSTNAVPPFKPPGSAR